MELCDTPSEIEHQATEDNTYLRERTRIQYERVYELFNKWCAENRVQTLSENVLLAYFEELAKDKKPTSLLATHSILRSTLNIKNNVDIGKYTKIFLFLKQKSRGYKPKKSNTLTKEEIQKFLNTAPDVKYLFTKTAFIFGIMGACRREELCNMDINHVEDLNMKLIIRIPDPSTKTERQFVVSGIYYNICKKYMALRPANLPSKLTRFFFNYQHGKCTKQPVGINKFGNLAKEIAEFLKLPNPTSYTGHCMRKTSAILAGRNPTPQYLYHPLNNDLGAGKVILHSFKTAGGMDKLIDGRSRNASASCNFKETRNVDLDSSGESGSLTIDVNIDCNDKTKNSSTTYTNLKQDVGKNFGASTMSFGNSSKEISRAPTAKPLEIYQTEAKETEKTDCTVCSRNDKCTSIFNLNYKGRNASDIFQDCTGLKIKTESFVICDNCTLDLLKCYQFVTKCQELSSIVVEREPKLQNVTVKQEVEDSDDETSFAEHPIKLEVYAEEINAINTTNRNNLPYTSTVNHRNCSAIEDGGNSFAEFTSDIIHEESSTDNLDRSPEYVNVSEMEPLAMPGRSHGVKRENFDRESSFGTFKMRKKDLVRGETPHTARNDREGFCFQDFQAFATENNEGNHAKVDKVRKKNDTIEIAKIHQGFSSNS